MRDYPIQTTVARRYRVLLMKNAGDAADALSLPLYKAGLDVTCVENVIAAEDLAANGHVDLILIAITGDSAAGLDSIRHLRACQLKQPIIVIMADADAGLRRKYLDAGCRDALAWPAACEHLHETLLSYLVDAPWEIQALTPLNSRLCEEVPEFGDLVNQFIGKLPELIAKIDVAYRRQEWQAFIQAVHNLKGMGGGFGFPQLTEHAAAIEKLHAQQDDSGIEHHISELHHLLLRIQAGIPQAGSEHEQHTG
ncbi:MAG: response regulator [Gammaproteobacteria bacterium]|nr:response regulator [Gammaproteobacteria bacterium]